MATPGSNEITQQLIAWSNGDAAALERLIPAVYQELRRMADHYFRRERAGHTLQPTALVHEVYLRLIDQRQERAETPLLQQRSRANRVTH